MIQSVCGWRRGTGSGGVSGGAAILVLVAGASGLPASTAHAQAGDLGMFNTAMWEPEDVNGRAADEGFRRSRPLDLSRVEPDEAASAPQPPGLLFRLRGGGDYMMHAGFADRENNGSISYVRARAALDVIKPFEDRSSLTFSFGTEVTFYDWTQPRAFFDTENRPFDEVYIYNLGATYAKPINADWTVFGGARVRSAFQDGARIQDSLTYGALAGASYRFHDDFRLGFGVAGTTRLEDTGWIVPIFTIDWQIDDRWRLRNDTGFGLALSYDIDDQLKVFAAAAYERREFRTNNNLALPRGIVRENSVPVGLGVDWTSQDRKLEFRVMGGVHAYQEYRFLDRDGNFVDKSDTKIAPVFRFEIGYNF